MSLTSSMGRDGYYDDNGHWQRTKICFSACKDCTCSPPGGMWVIPVKRNKIVEDNEMTTRNAQSEEGTENCVSVVKQKTED